MCVLRVSPQKKYIVNLYIPVANEQLWWFIVEARKPAQGAPLGVHPLRGRLSWMLESSVVNTAILIKELFF